MLFPLDLPFKRLSPRDDEICSIFRSTRARDQRCPQEGRFQNALLCLPRRQSAGPAPSLLQAARQPASARAAGEAQDLHRLCAKEVLALANFPPLLAKGAEDERHFDIWPAMKIRVPPTAARQRQAGLAGFKAVGVGIRV